MTDQENPTITAKFAANWLGESAITPAGQAWCAVREADHPKLETILRKHGRSACAEAMATNGQPCRALTAAARQGDTLAVRMLIDAGANVNARNDEFMIAAPRVWSPLAWGVGADSLGVVRILIAAGADVNPDGERLAYRAILSGNHIANPLHHPVLEALLRAGTLPTTDALIATLELHREGAPEWAAQLLDAGADPNARDASPGGVQPLDIVLKKAGNRRTHPLSKTMQRLQVLLDAGVDVNAEIGPTGLHCRPPLLAAIENGAAWAIQPLLKAGADPDATLRRITRDGIRDDNESIDAINLLFAALTPSKTQSKSTANRKKRRG